MLKRDLKKPRLKVRGRLSYLPEPPTDTFLSFVIAGLDPAIHDEVQHVQS
jgi:hypothetical protein